MKRSFRLAAVHIALAAMLLRAWMPTGWMPSADAATGSPIAICTMNGSVQLDLSSDGKPIKHKQSSDDSRHRDLCPFATAPHMALAVAMDFAPPSPVSKTAQRAVHRDCAAQSARYAPQSPRAPPHFA